MAQRHLLPRFALTPLVVLIACSNADDAQDPPPQGPSVVGDRAAGDFVSGNVAGSSAPGTAVAAEDSGGEASAVASPTAKAGPANSSEAARAISEADIVQIDGDVLYALSEYSGLTLVDISDPAHLALMGRYRVGAIPFEMYVRGDTVIAMFNSFGHYAYDEEAQATQWVESSRVQALDTSNPSNIVVTGDFEVPGTIDDSRLVGDVLYLATSEWGCWRCSNGPSTLVTSYDISNLSKIEQIDQLRFEEPEDTYIGTRSISVTKDRIYIGGRDWNWEDSQQSTIQIVDITDPEGDLVAGAEVPIKGGIDSRWQMDEYEGTLRVLSQWDRWQSDFPPQLETFAVHSSADVEKLANLQLKLPRDESLQSVRFDGPRAYAITFEQTDPLFTFDLSDPAAPKQVGELEMPGWVYHMEPRGDRLYGVGYDRTNDEQLHVSVFDVSDLSTPTLLDRVNFGGQWSTLAEDQDRIHKSFKLLDEQGMIVVPFSGYYQDDEDDCSGSYLSGIQLIDFTDDALTKRGVAPQTGNARRALVHRDRLLGFSDDAVQSFDFSDRDNIAKLDTLHIARNISTVRVLGDHVLRFGTDWWTEQTTFDVTPIADAQSADVGSTLDLSSFVQTSKSCNEWSSWGNVYVNGDVAYVVRYHSDYAEESSLEELNLLVVDISDLDSPKLIDTVEAEPMRSTNSSYGYFTDVVQTDSALLVGQVRSDFTTNQSTQTVEYQVFDIRNPRAPTKTTTFEVPATLSRWGWASFVGGCGLDMGWGWGGYYSDTTSIVSGDVVASSHSEPLEDDRTQARFYLDRLDVSDPESPKLLPSVNVPGNVIHYDHGSARVWTQETLYTPLKVGRDDCWERQETDPAVMMLYFNDSWSCSAAERSVHVLDITDNRATLTASMPLENGDWHMSTMAVTDKRLFIKQFEPQIINEAEYRYWTEGTQRVLVLNPELERLGVLEVPDTARGWAPMRARGTRAFEPFAGEVVVYDAADPDNLTASTKEISGFGCSEIEVRGDVAFCAQGKRGVEMIPLN